MLVTVHVRRHLDEYVQEDLAADHISRVSPPETDATYGCRVTLSTQPVSLMLRETREQLRALIHSAARSPEPPESPDDAYRRGLQKARDDIRPAMRRAYCLIRQFPPTHEGAQVWLKQYAKFGSAQLVRVGEMYERRVTTLQTSVSRWTHLHNGAHVFLLGCGFLQGDSEEYAVYTPEGGLGELGLMRKKGFMANFTQVQP